MPSVRVVKRIEEKGATRPMFYGSPSSLYHLPQVSPRDGSAGVRTGADMLDRLIKDIVIEKNELPNVSSVIVSLRYVASTAPCC